MTERRSKYNARRVKIDGITFDSAAEARRYGELKLLEQAGHLTGLKVHPRYEIIPPVFWHGRWERAVFYEADFEYNDSGYTFVEEVKGVRTAVYQLKRKLFLLRYPDVEFVEMQA